MQADPRSLAGTIQEAEAAGALMVVTGAGVSLASGIPTFRGTDAGAVRKHDVLEMATFEFFARHPEESWRWYLHRFDVVFGKQPNPAHLALVELERWVGERGGDFLLVTQNIDTLHEQAGSRNLVKVHGSADRVRCASDHCPLGAPAGWLPRDAIDLARFRAEPTRPNLPRCQICGTPLRPHVLWFDELYDGHDDYQLERTVACAGDAALILFVGTSFSVGITDILLRAGRAAGARLLSIDPGATPPPCPGVEVVTAAAERLLPEVVGALDALRLEGAS